MTDVNNNNGTLVDGQPIRTTLAEALSRINPDVAQSVVGVMVDREIEKRSKIIVQALDMLDREETTLKRIKPDQMQFNENGTVISQSYSQSALQSRNKQVDKVQKLTAAINKALEGDLQGVNKFIGGGGDKTEN